MENIDHKYVAIRNLTFNGVRAYNEGDLVHEAAVEGPDAWLEVGTDVAPREGAVLSLPPKNASQTTWSAFAISRGADRDEAEGMSRNDLIAEYGEPEPTHADEG